MAAPISIDTLLSPTVAGEAEWKRYLFYMIAYCDTWHDFSKERPLEGEGRSVSKTDLPDRPAFVMSIIEQMNAGFISRGVIDSLKPGRGFSFENNVGKEFLRATNNVVLQKIPAGEAAIKASIESYIKSLFTLTRPGDTNQCEYLSLSNFNAAGSVPPRESSLIEITIPASVYSEGTVPMNILLFLRKLYPESIEGFVQGSPPPADGALKFIEDASSFPRELFTGMLNRFKKIITTQTKWDPAGLSMSGFEGSTITANERVIAPSFLAEYPRTHNITPELNNYYFDQGTNTLSRTGRPPLTITKAGPSVNHIFMHMILEKSDLPIDVKNKYKSMINAAKVESKKNMPLPLDDSAGQGTPEQRALRLRRLAASKRSGDYENIHSAIRTKAVMFTGDEPAFTYGVLNKCRMIYHVNTRGTHTFKLYTPPPETQEALAAQRLQAEKNGLLLEASELLKIFGATTDFYKEYLTNIKTVLFTGNISVCGDEEVGRILRFYFVNELLNEKPFFEQLRRACNLYRTNGVPPITYAGILSMNVQQLRAAVATETARINGISESGVTLLNKINELRKKIPLRFSVSGQAKCLPLKATLFEVLPITAKPGSEFITKGAVKYSLLAGSMFPEYKYLEGNLAGIARLKKINERSTNPGLQNKNKKLISETLDSLGISCIPTQEQIDAVQPSIVLVIDTLLAAFSPAVGGTLPGRKTRRNQKLSYEEIYERFLRTEESEIPFDFTPKEYADAFIYRYILNDCINKLSKESVDPMIELYKGSVFTDSENVTELSETPMAKQVRYTDENESDPMLVQSGGVPILLRDEIKNFCIHLYYNTIEPFLRKYSFDNLAITHTNVIHNLMRAAVSGSLFEDLEVLLEEICGAPGFTQGYIGNAGSLVLYNNMITSATTAINSIFTNLQNSSQNPSSNIHIRIAGQGVGDGIIVRTIQDIYHKYRNPSTILNDSFFEDMTKIYTFLNSYILYDESQPVVLTRVAVTAELNARFHGYTGEDFSDMQKRSALTNYTKFAVEDYIKSQKFTVDTAAEVATEQARRNAAYTRIRDRLLVEATPPAAQAQAQAQAQGQAQGSSFGAQAQAQAQGYSFRSHSQRGRRGGYRNVRSGSRYRRNGSPRRKSLKRK